ncbi:MAG TPA: hypothetical protein VJK48_05510 [Chlamydiales bacterium]|nr:hypothetical protein [Chlamydiales bacterium]
MMIALALAMICAVPLLTKPIRIFRSEIKFIEEGERERLADWTFSEIKAELFIKSDFHHLPSLHETMGPIQLPPISIELPKLSPRVVNRSYVLYCKGEKESKEGKSFRLFYVKIHFTPDLWGKKKIYEYRLAVDEESVKPVSLGK